MPVLESEQIGNTAMSAIEARGAMQKRRAVFNVVVLSVAAHSVVLGICYLVFPVQTLRLAGWEYSGQVFWPSQAGLFLLILGLAYGAAVRVRPLVWLVIGSKASAFVFLVASAVWLDAPPLAAVLGYGDGLMGLAVGIALWRLHRAERSP